MTFQQFIETILGLITKLIDLLKNNSIALWFGAPLFSILIGYMIIHFLMSKIMGANVDISVDKPKESDNKNE